MNLIIDALFICLTVLTCYDLVQRHARGSSYRKLLRKKDKSDLEIVCLRECKKFFEPNIWHKLYFSVVVPAYIVMVFIYDTH
tara:strand:- start:278 stop:523 length:246 start_codon:yes stop_codon:yes gene_type:complete